MKKKICMLGSFAVGKTSLVRRFVHSIFSESYLTTIGVNISKKTVMVKEEEVELILWDLHGEDEFQTVQSSYLRGAAGCLLIVDGTRSDTLDTALSLHERVEKTVGTIPCLLIFNKSDLTGEWEIEGQRLDDLSNQGWSVLLTSAKTGMGVEKAFLGLVKKMLRSAT